MRELAWLLGYAAMVVVSYLILDQDWYVMQVGWVTAVLVWLVLTKMNEWVRAREIRDEAARRAREARSTGTWRSAGGEEGSGALIEVRWDAIARVYFVRSADRDSGLNGEPEGPGEWTAWPDVERLAGFLEGLEGRGWTWASDGATKTIRARLDLPGWWQEWERGRVDHD